VVGAEAIDSVAAKNALEKSAKGFFLRLEIALDRIEGCPVVLESRI
jgi:hypothetical protein